IVVRDEVVLELKTVERLHPIHDAQILTYLRLSGLKKGLLLNFHAPALKDGLRRMVL
ncbi:MAG: GxxExxY protein, partial [Rhodospirillaceae bacterium]|nr:GxxExxY protein [Rhodospirillaceae bacterium]